MRKSLIWAASAMMAIGLLTGCGSSKSAETTAEASVARAVVRRALPQRLRAVLRKQRAVRQRYLLTTHSMERP